MTQCCTLSLLNLARHSWYNGCTQSRTPCPPSAQLLASSSTTCCMLTLTCAQDVSESEVQHLREVLQLPRQACVHSLRATRGDVAAALRNELAGFGWDDSILRRLAQDYATYRQVLLSSRRCTRQHERRLRAPHALTDKKTLAMLLGVPVSASSSASALGWTGPATCSV